MLRSMAKKVYNLSRTLLQKTGRDIVRLSALEALNAELEAKKKQLETVRSEGDRSTINALEKDLDFQRRYHEAYRLERCIVPLRTDRYSYIKNVNNDELLIYSAMKPEDFDWLEEAIFKYGYYEKPNIWSFGIDEDKRVLAEIIGTFKPRRTVDFGCANGPVVQALVDRGITAEGIEISSFAVQRALPEIKSRIHHGDILTLPLIPASYDMLTGFDIFEHLNPNKIDAYLAKAHELLAPGGHIFTNIPAFGKDEVFGEVFQYYMPDWDHQRDGSSSFKQLHADMHGFPVNGHLIWADTKWWVGLFERHGFERRLDKERQLHSQYNVRLVESRKSFYVFQKK
jgi:2-polyprenyl-3-methyl-5-hydroxy-6-metoxy-1,4-benzoquinol methylase